MAVQESNVRSIERALNILDCFSREKPALSLVEISRMLDMSPSTVSRMVGTMETMGYLQRNEESLLYSLGYKLPSLGAIYLSSVGVREAAKPHMIALRNQFNESVGLFVVEKMYRVCVEFVPSTQPIHRVMSIGTRMELTNGATGRVLLAYQDPDFARQVLLVHPSGVTFDQLEQIKKQGYATSHNENPINHGLRSVAVPVFNANHEIEAAIFICGPENRIDEKRMDEMIIMAKEEAWKISKKLGY